MSAKTMSKAPIIAAAVAVALSAGAMSTTAHAAEMEKCYGVSKAGTTIAKRRTLLAQVRPKWTTKKMHLSPFPKARAPKSPAAR